MNKNATTGDGLSELTDEPSRGDLFKRVVAASRAGEQETASDMGIPFNLYGPFAFPNDAVYDVVDKKPRANSLFGVDISHYTPGAVPLEEFALLQINYVYCKATQGADAKDFKFSVFWRRLAALPPGRRVHRGAYHFLTAKGDGNSQAMTFVKVIRENGGLQPTDMPPVVDLEWDVVKRGGPDRWAEQDPNVIISKTLTCMTRIQRELGRTPILYTSRAWWRERIGSEAEFARFAQYNIWIADYSRSSRAVEVPNVPNGAKWALWQFTNSAKLSVGLPSPLDASIYKDSAMKVYQDFQVRPFSTPGNMEPIHTSDALIR